MTLRRRSRLDCRRRGWGSGWHAGQHFVYRRWRAGAAGAARDAFPICYFPFKLIQI